VGALPKGNKFSIRLMLLLLLLHSAITRAAAASTSAAEFPEHGQLPQKPDGIRLQVSRRVICK
jgi:hypothetical protein